MVSWAHRVPSAYKRTLDPLQKRTIETLGGISLDLSNVVD
jgi:hypothetical protein